MSVMQPAPPPLVTLKRLDEPPVPRPCESPATIIIFVPSLTPGVQSKPVPLVGGFMSNDWPAGMTPHIDTCPCADESQLMRVGAHWPGEVLFMKRGHFTWTGPVKQFEDPSPTVRTSEVPPAPTPFASLRTATNCEPFGNLSSGTVIGPLSPCWSTIVRISGLTCPTGTSRSSNGACPPSHVAVRLPH